MIYKESCFSSYSPEGDPLMRVLDFSTSELEKTAQVHPEILKFKQLLEPEPNKTYVHILALGAGDYYGPNLNNDHFPWSGLSHDSSTTPHPYLHGFKTFLNAHSFAHHVNKDPEKSYGDVVISVLNNRMKRVELIVAIDHERCERNGGGSVLRKIHDGDYPSTSMGCRVPYDTCSICGHNSRYRHEYCDHMKLTPGKLLPDGRKVFVYNQYPRFFDISFVFIGADRTSFVLEKVANREGVFVPEQFEKVASTRFGKALRGAVGMRQKQNKIRIKHKVQRQQKLIPKLTTFGKLNSVLKKNTTAGAASGLVSRSFSPDSQSTVRYGGFLDLGNHDESNPFGTTRIRGRDIEVDSGNEKTSSAKLAEAEKLSEIFKQVNSLPMGRAVPLRVGREVQMPDEVLDRIADQGDLPSSLGGLGAAGIALNKPEFQRVYLRAHGAGDLASQLQSRGQVFGSGVPGDIKRVRIMITGRAPSNLMSLLGPLLRERSSITPVAVRRHRVIMARPVHPESHEMRSGILDKVASAYDSYRTNLLLNLEDLVKTAMHTPEIMSMISSERGGDYNSTSGLLTSLSLMPLAYFTQAYRDGHCGCGMTDIEFALSFARKNPEIAKYLSAKVARSTGHNII